MQAINAKSITSDNGVSSTSRKLLLSDHLYYSAPFLTMVWLGAPIHILQGIYAKYYGFSLTTLASVILFARLFDAITDPLIGYYSDQYHRRAGTRKPFVLAGGSLLIISAYFLYVPIFIDSRALGAQVGLAYFTTWFMMLYLAITLFEIPHGAWASEIALSSVDKAKIFSFRNVAGSLGMVCFYSVPLLPFFKTNEITPETLKISVITAGIIMLPMLYVCLKNTPDGPAKSVSNKAIPASDNPPHKTNSSANRILILSIIYNKPLLIFFGAFLTYGFAIGMWLSLIFFYVDSFLGLGKQFAQMFLLAFAVGIVATPVWCKLSIVFGKKSILVVAMVLLIMSFIYATLLVPGTAGFRELIILQVINVLGAGCMTTFAPAMLSEIVDYSIWKYRSESTATFYAIFMFLAKFNIAIGGALGLAIAGWYGFDATTTEQTSLGVEGLFIGLVWLPALFIIFALVLIILSPINIRRHGIVRRRLDVLVSSAPVIKPQTLNVEK